MVLPIACLPFLKPVLHQITAGRFGSSADKSNLPTGGSSRPDQTIQPTSPWAVDKKYGTSTAFVRTAETDERPFTRLHGGDSDPSLSDEANIDIELQDVRPSRVTSPGIVVVKEVTMESKSTHSGF